MEKRVHGDVRISCGSMILGKKKVKEMMGRRPIQANIELSLVNTNISTVH